MKKKPQQNQNSSCGEHTDQNRTSWLEQNFQFHEKGRNTIFFFSSLNYVVPFVPLTWCCGDMSNYWYSIDSPVAQSPLFGSIWFLWNHGITEWFRLKGTLEILQFQPPNSSSNILCSLREIKVLVLWGANLCSKNPNQPKISISSEPHPKGWAGQGFSPMWGGKEEGSCK